jgi:hypothetical protein
MTPAEQQVLSYFEEETLDEGKSTPRCVLHAFFISCRLRCLSFTIPAILCAFLGCRLRDPPGDDDLVCLHDNCRWPDGMRYRFHRGCFGRSRSHSTQSARPEDEHEPRVIRELANHNDWVTASLGVRRTEEEQRQLAQHEALVHRFISLSPHTDKLEIGESFHHLLPERDVVKFNNFVAFIGNTGSGKSFLISGLLKSSQRLQRQIDGHQAVPFFSFNGPIVAGPNSGSTTADMNLYLSRLITDNHRDMYFLDCEGPAGSERPTGMIFDGRQSVTDWLNTRRTYIDIVYPRITYLLSNVLCVVEDASTNQSGHVASNVHAIARAGAEGVKNTRGRRPALIVIFNKRLRGEFISNSADATANFQAQAQNTWNKSKQKETVHSVDVIHFPDASQRPIVAQQQFRILQDTILRRNTEIITKDRELRQELSATTQMLYLKMALAKYSVLDKGKIPSFDFSEAARLIAPPEPRFADYLHWAGHACLDANPLEPSDTLDVKKRKIELAHAQFKALQAYMLPRAISAQRLGQTELASSTTEELVRAIGKATKSFADREPCQGVAAEGRWHKYYCQNNRVGHASHNHSHKGALAAEGSYQPLTDLFHNLADRQHNSIPQLSRSEQARVRDEELFSRLRSTITCLGCLSNPPAFILDCQHALCYHCVIENKVASQVDGSFQLPLLGEVSCPLCPVDRRRRQLNLRPLGAMSGYRILSLDGGGVRGIIQLLVLAQLERYCLGIQVVKLFDMIIGTSVGGIAAVALGTGSRGKTVSDLLEEFQRTMEGVFPERTWFGAHELQVVKAFFRGNGYNDSPEAYLRQILCNPSGSAADQDEKMTTAPNGSPGPHVATVSIKLNDRTVSIARN